jgi:hypothetical protein
MVITYRRPGVYLEESLLVNPADVAGTVTVACFVGVTGKGPINEPTLCESWSNFVMTFGGFNPIATPTPVDPNNVTSLAFVGASPATLAALKASTTYGDGYYIGPDFDSGKYVVLQDTSLAHYLMPAFATNRKLVVAGSRYASDVNITASDATNAAKLAAGTTEVQTLTPTGTLSGGTFTLTVLGVTTGTIAYNATSVIIKAAIDAAIAGNTIAVAGGPINTTAVTLTYTGYGDVAQATVNTAALTGTNPVITPTTTTPGTGEGFAVSPTTAWTTGQAFYIENPDTVGADYAFYWNGTTWQPGVAGGGTAKANPGTWNVGPYPGTADPIPAAVPILSYLPFAVYSFFQNGGRFAWIIRSVSALDKGTSSSIDVNSPTGTGPELQSFTLVARSVGTWGDTIKYNLVTQSTVGTTDPQNVFALQVLIRNSEGKDEVVETWPSLSVRGTLSGTRRVDAVLNDPSTGSQYVRVVNMNDLRPQPAATTDAVALTGGVDPGTPDAATMVASANNVTKLEGPITLNICGYLSDAGAQDSIDAATKWVSATVASSTFPDRQDIFVVNDSAPPRIPGVSSSSYKTTIQSYLSQNTGDSYSASYGPWIVIPHPARIGTTLAIPPAGAVIGMMARIDATVGVFRAPAGVIAGLSNAVGVQTKFTDTELGDLNAQNINIIRSVVGAGICVMGGRTRKTYGTDRYVSARRTLIYIKEAMRRSTQFAVFENNDQRLWSALRMSGERLLRPLWEAGGLRGASAGQAYFIRCDDTINTPAVIQSGEVRMELGVALEYPAEFIIIRVTQFDQGTFTAEVQPQA